MALRLAGEECPVQGLDGAGWLKEITRIGDDPALTVTQNGAGVGLQVNGDLLAAQQGDPSKYLVLNHSGTYALLTTSVGEIRFAKELYAQGADFNLNNNLLKNAKLGTTMDCDSKTLDNAGHIYMATGDLHMRHQGQIRGKTSGANVPIIAKTDGGDEEVARIYATTTAGSGRLRIAKGELTGSLDAGDQSVEKAAFKTCKVTSDERGTPVEGDLKWDAASHKLQVYSGTAWETVTSS